MKILMLIDSLDIGGAETHLEILAYELSAMKHKIIIASAGGEICDRLAQNGVKCVVFPNITNNKNAYSSTRKGINNNQILGYAPLFCRIWAVHNIILRIIRREKPDLVHAHTRRTAFLVNKICQKYKIPLVVTVHAKFSMNFPKRLFSKWGDRTIAVSKDIKEYLAEQGVARDKIDIILNGVKLPNDIISRPLDITGAKN